MGIKYDNDQCRRFFGLIKERYGIDPDLIDSIRSEKRDCTSEVVEVLGTDNPQSVGVFLNLLDRHSLFRNSVLGSSYYHPSGQFYPHLEIVDSRERSDPRAKALAIIMFRHCLGCKNPMEAMVRLSETKNTDHNIFRLGADDGIKFEIKMDRGCIWLNYIFQKRPFAFIKFIH